MSTSLNRIFRNAPNSCFKGASRRTFFHGDFVTYRRSECATFCGSSSISPELERRMFSIMTHERRGALRHTLTDHPVFVDNSSECELHFERLPALVLKDSPSFVHLALSLFPFYPAQKKKLGPFRRGSPGPAELSELTEMEKHKLPPPII